MIRECKVKEDPDGKKNVFVSSMKRDREKEKEMRERKRKIENGEQFI